MRLVNLGLEVEHALVIDFVIEDGVTGCALFHELGENPGFVGGFPLVGHFVQNQLAHGFALPERDDGFLVSFAGGRLDVEGGLFAAVQNVEILQRVTAQLREGRRSLGRVTLLADDQLAGINLDVFVFQQIGKRLWRV